MTQIAAAITIKNQLTSVKNDLEGVWNHVPLLVKSQKMPDVPYVNHDAKRLETTPRRSLKSGML